jgi:hypothetical protein
MVGWVHSGIANDNLSTILDYTARTTNLLASSEDGDAQLRWVHEEVGSRNRLKPVIPTWSLPGFVFGCDRQHNPDTLVALGCLRSYLVIFAVSNLAPTPSTTYLEAFQRALEQWQTQPVSSRHVFDHVTLSPPTDVSRKGASQVCPSPSNKPFASNSPLLRLLVIPGPIEVEDDVSYTQLG